MTDSDAMGSEPHPQSGTSKVEVERKSNPPANPPPSPPMRVVTKGWWTLKEQEVDIEELRREAADERK